MIVIFKIRARALELHKASEILQASIKKNAGGSLQVLMNDFKNCLDQTLESIESILQSRESARQLEESPYDHEPARDNSELMPHLRRLARLLEEDDADAVQCLETIKQISGGLIGGGDLKEIEEYMGNYDFDSALAILRRISLNLNVPLEEDVNR